MANRLIVALDMTTVEDARRMATLLAGTAVSFFKIGLARSAATPTQSRGLGMPIGGRGGCRWRCS